MSKTFFVDFACFMFNKLVSLILPSLNNLLQYMCGRLELLHTLVSAVKAPMDKHSSLFDLFVSDKKSFCNSDDQLTMLKTFCRFYLLHV
jgi:hypothetical protein